MRYVFVLLLVAAQISAFAVSARAGSAAAPRVALGVDAKSSQRYVQLTERGAVYPTADVTCDGNRRTIALTRSSNAGDRTIAVYVVPPKISELMLKAAECRLLLPDQEIAVPRAQLRAAWSPQPKTAKP
ncbi:MAG TPA: hypothetical protein VIF11_04520 [Methylomirabilota bacterium]|jgi:hypothetical protein